MFFSPPIGRGRHGRLRPGERIAELMSEDGEAGRVPIQQRAGMTPDHRTLPWALKKRIFASFDPSKEDRFLIF